MAARPFHGAGTGGRWRGAFSRPAPVYFSRLGRHPRRRPAAHRRPRRHRCYAGRGRRLLALPPGPPPAGVPSLGQIRLLLAEPRDHGRDDFRGGLRRTGRPGLENASLGGRHHPFRPRRGRSRGFHLQHGPDLYDRRGPGLVLAGHARIVRVDIARPGLFDRGASFGDGRNTGT